MKLRINILVLILLAVLSASVFAQLPERYTTYNEACSTLAYYQNRYPEICRFDTMGYSTRDSLPMLRFKISDNVGVDEDEPAVFYCGGEHADEVLGVEVVMYFINDIMGRYARGDSVTIRYINNLEIFCVPFINPEGHTVVEGGDMDWRKNKCDNDHNNIFNFHDGVDNNRNYDFGWNDDTTPNGLTPESLEYKGTAPFTQNENIAMRDFAWHYRPVVALAYHSPTYGRAEKAYYNWYWYAPNGHGMAPDEAFQLSVCRQYCSRITNDAGDSTYEARRGLVNKGDLKTYLYGNFATVAFTVEISDTTIQRPALVDTICIHHLPSQYYLLGRALGPGITGIVRDSVTLEPIEAEVRVVERTNADVHPRLSRPDTGRYRRLLEAGTFTLTFLKSGYLSRTVNNVVVTSSGNPTVVDKLLPPINPRPPSPVKIYPPPDTVIIDSIPALTWHTSRYATRYRLEVYADSALTNLVYFDSTITDTTRVPTIPEGDSLLYWQVRGGNTYGWGPYSTTWSFLMHYVIDAIDETVLPQDITLGQNYPNPFNMQTSISLAIPNGKRGELAIFDIGGRIVNDLKLTGTLSGTQQVTWNGRNSNGQELKSGVYFYRLRVGDRSFTKSMILLK
jgi:hypothetical protein